MAPSSGQIQLDLSDNGKESIDLIMMTLLLAYGKDNIAVASDSCKVTVNLAAAVSVTDVLDIVERLSCVNA